MAREISEESKDLEETKRNITLRNANNRNTRVEVPDDLMEFASRIVVDQDDGKPNLNNISVASA